MDERINVAFRRSGDVVEAQYIAPGESDGSTVEVEIARDVVPVGDHGEVTQARTEATFFITDDFEPEQGATLELGDEVWTLGARAPGTDDSRSRWVLDPQ